MPLPGRGRPRLWCSQRCRRAAYEERRAAAAGAIAVKIVEVAPPVPTHALDECVVAVVESSTACRHVLNALGEKAARGELTSDRRWGPVLQALGRLLDRLTPPGRRYS